MDPDWTNIFAGYSYEERAKIVGHGLVRAFQWDRTKDGNDYWYQIRKKLMGLIPTVNTSFSPGIQKSVCWETLFKEAGHELANCSDEAYRARAEILAESLVRSFSWNCTMEGHDYWQNIYNKLQALELLETKKEDGIWWDTKLPKRID